MRKKPAKTAPDEVVATRDEVDQAIDGLSEAQLLKLRKFAGWRIRGLGRAALRREANDLLGEALASTLAGAERAREGRRWNKAVDFVKHLTEAMRSISSHWKLAFDEQEAHLESELVIVDPEGQEHSPLEDVRAEDPAADRALMAKEEVGRIFAMFKDDDEAILVLEGWVEGITGPGMLELGFTRQQYDAAVRRIRYALRERAGR